MADSTSRARRGGDERRTNLLPHPTSFVGRAADLARLHELFTAGERLVSVVGPPGTGKTRLALRYAERQLDGEAAPGGVWFADLTSARGLDDVCGAIGRALQIPLTGGSSSDDMVAQLGHAIAGRGPLLLVLDNFEQVVDCAAATLGRWLPRAPRARFLVTSREILRLPGEAACELGPLGVPAGPRADAAHVVLAEAVQLLCARARGYVMADADAPVIAEIVRQLDGIPLAIELAATRLKVLSPAKLLERLPRRLDFLTAGPRAASERQGTLRGAIDWSWQLLSDWEQALLGQCAVFRGGFSLEAAEAVIDVTAHADAPPLLDALQALREKSLLRTYEPPGLPGDLRFGLYESIRDYAAERLEQTGAGAVAAARHARYFVAWGTDWAQRVDGPGGVSALRRFVLEIDNLTAVYDRTVGARTASPELTALGARALLTLDPVYSARGPAAVYLTMLDAAVAALDADSAGAALRAGLLEARGRVRRSCGRMSEALDDLGRALALAREVGSRYLEAVALTDLGELHQEQGRLDEARDALEQALAIPEGGGESGWQARALASLGLLRHAQGALDEALTYFRRALGEFRRVGHRRAEAGVLKNFGVLRLQQGRLAEARSFFEEAFAIHREIGDRRLAGLILGNLGILAQEQGRLDLAGRYYRRALARLRKLGDRLLEGHLRGYLGGLYQEQSRPDAAQRCYEAAIAILREVGDRRTEGLFLAALGGIEAACGRPEAAREGFAAAEVLLAEVGDPGLLGALALHRGHLDLARARAVAATGQVDAAAAHRRAVLELVAAARRPAAAGDDGGDGSLAARSDDARFALRMLERALTREAFVAGPECRWFRPPAGELVRLEDRRSLRLMLLGLVERRAAAPGAALSMDDLLELGWPGEQVIAEAGTNRVKVALTALRRLGLRDVLVRRDDGYLLDPTVPLMQSTDEA